MIELTRVNSASLAAISIAVGLVVFAIKLLAWHMTGSVALFSDALESTVNIGAAMAAFVAIRLSRQPDDDNHPYGHQKAEYLSAVLEAALIVLAAAMIFREAALELMNPRPIEQPWAGLAVNLCAGAINAAWATILIRHGRRERSPALLADGKHIMADVVTSAGVVVGLALAIVTGWSLFDPILAAVVAVHVLRSGWSLMRDSVGGLMDAAPPEAELALIRKAIADNCAGALEAHDLRTRHAGKRTFVEFHLVVPGDMTVTDAHVICDRIEAAIRREMGESMISIHVEPPHKAKHDGAVTI